MQTGNTLPLAKYCVQLQTQIINANLDGFMTGGVKKRQETWSEVDIDGTKHLSFSSIVVGTEHAVADLC